MTNSKARPNHPVGCNDHYRARISTVSIFGGLITNQVPTTRLRTTVKSVQRPVPHLSHDAQQQTTSRSLCYVQRSIPYNDQYRTCLPTPNSDRRLDHSVGCNGHCRTRISTVPISRRKTVNHVPTTRVHTSKPRPDHPFSYNSHCRTTISTVPIFKRPTSTGSPTLVCCSQIITPNRAARPGVRPLSRVSIPCVPV